MNVLIVSAMFPPIRTGTSFYTKNLAAHLAQLGWNVTVVTAKNVELATEDFSFKLEKLNSLHINLKSYFKHLRFCSFYPSNYRRMVTLASENNVQLIILVNHYLDIAFPAIWASRKLKIPIVVSVGTQMQSMNPFMNSILKFMDRLICGRFIFPNVKAIISWDSEIERYIREVQRSKIAEKSVVIPFGPNGDTAASMNYRKDYSKRSMVILGVGAIISQRNYLFHVLVLNHLLKKQPNLKLRIIGHQYTDKPILLAKELGISENVEFLGELPHNEVIQEMRNADIHWMMLSASYVGLGTATLEAMALGIPVISNSPENLIGKGRLKDLQNYIYCDGMNAVEFSEKLWPILSDSKSLETIGLGGRYLVNEYLNWNFVASEYSRMALQWISPSSNSQ